MPDREKVIAEIEEQIAWIRDNDFHKFPSWGHVVLTMEDAIALLKEQEAVVRCKDCKRYYANGGNCDQVLADWFCADGERK